MQAAPKGADCKILSEKRLVQWKSNRSTSRFVVS